MYSNSYCSYKFAPKQEKIGQSSHKEYSNNILKYLEFMAIKNACTKKVWKLIECTSYFKNFISCITWKVFIEIPCALAHGNDV